MMQEGDDKTRVVAAAAAPPDDATRLVEVDATQLLTRHAIPVGRPAANTVTPAAPAAEATAAPTGRTIKQRFVLQQVLGSGGMGSVFKAIDLRKQEASDRDPYVAIKLLNEDFEQHPDAFISLQREARKSQTLAHPNIVNVYDFDRDGDTVFMTMECLTGQPLDKLLREHADRGLPRPQALSILRDMGAALAYAHSHNIAHSDFKPGNVFVSEKGSAKVLDFGIARAVSGLGGEGGGGEHTVFDPGSLGALTPAYASLEMLRGEEPDPRDDVYALGCVAYELFAGRHPFGRKTAEQALQEGLKPRRIPGLKRRQWRALEQALAFPRAQRLPTVAALLAAFDERRSPLWWLAAVVVLVSMAGAAAWWYRPQPEQPDLTTLRADVETEVKQQFTESELDRLLGAIRYDAEWLGEFDLAFREYQRLLPANDPGPVQRRQLVIEHYLAEVARRRQEGELTNAHVLLEQLVKWGGDAIDVSAERQLLDVALEQQRAERAASQLEQQAAERERQARAEEQRTQEQQRQVLADQQRTVTAAETAVREALACRGGMDTNAVAERWRALQQLDAKRQQALAPEVGKQVASCVGTLARSNPAAAEQLLRWGVALLPGDAGLAAVKIDPCLLLSPGSGGRSAQNVCVDQLSGGGRGPRLVVVPGRGGAKPFAIGKYEVSGEEFAAFCRAGGGCDAGAFKGNQPARNIGAAQAEKYLAWLGKQSGFRYRLPTQAEWSHVAGADRSEPDPNRNCTVNAKGLSRGGFPVPVTTGRANRWGLVNAAGNVREFARGGGGVVALGGSFSDSIERCTFDTRADHNGAGDQETGLRVLRELAANP